MAVLGCDKLWHNDISKRNSFRKCDVCESWIYTKETQGVSRPQFLFNFELSTNKETNKLTREQIAKEKKTGRAVIIL